MESIFIDSDCNNSLYTQCGIKEDAKEDIDDYEGDIVGIEK
jgi:hypothetical protein